MRNQIAGAVRVINKSSQRTEGCSSEQRNCSSGGAPSEKQGCRSNAHLQKQLSKHRNAISEKQKCWSSATAQNELSKLKRVLV